MKITNYFGCILLIAALGMGSCKKMDKPVLASDYPVDHTVTPSTSLRFYASFDSTTASDKQINIRFKDSVSGYPSFFPPSNIGFGQGVKGSAYQGNTGGFIHYVNANDFGSSTDFTISFWLKTTLSQKDHNNADGIMALADTTNFWSSFVVFADHESSTSDSMVLKWHFTNGTGDNWDFAPGDANSRWPHMYDGKWHHVVFAYNAASKTATLYRDGVQFRQQTNETISFVKNNVSQLVVGGFQEAIGVKGTYAENTWMSGFPGMLDNIRLYNSTLSASDVANLYANKL